MSGWSTTASVEMENDLDSNVLNDFVPESYLRNSLTISTDNAFGAVFVSGGNEVWVCIIIHTIHARTHVGEHAHTCVYTKTRHTHTHTINTKAPVHTDRYTGSQTHKQIHTMYQKKKQQQE